MTCNAAISQTWLEINEIFILGRLEYFLDKEDVSYSDP